MTLLCLPHRLEIQLVQGPLYRLEKANGAIGSRHGIFAERKLVQLPYTFPVVFSQGLEEFEQFDRVH